MNLKKGLGIALIFAGLLLVATGKIITGAVIGTNFQNYPSMLGILIFIIGVFLVFNYEWDKYRINLILDEYESGELNPVQAVLKINDNLFPKGIKITGVDYRGGKKGTVRTEKGHFPIRLNKDDDARNLALALYEIALINDRNNARNCELHLGKRASSKHHREGLQRIIENFEDRYKEDLKAARAA